MPIAEKDYVIDGLVVTNLVAEPITEVQAILVVDWAVGLASPMHVSEHRCLVELTTELFNV